MNDKEAIKRLKEVIEDCTSGEDEPYKEAFGMAILALEKQIPKKPIENFYHSRYGEDDYDEGYWYNCSTCEFQEVGRYSTEYEDWINRHKCCPECGQLIEW